jgi:hypothetical protein
VADVTQSFQFINAKSEAKLSASEIIASAPNLEDFFSRKHYSKYKNQGLKEYVVAVGCGAHIMHSRVQNRCNSLSK